MQSNTANGYPWEIDDLEVNKSGRYHSDYKMGKTLGGPRTEGDYDMEGPFTKFVPQEFTPPNNTAETSLGIIRATGVNTRHGITRAMTVQNAA